MSENVSISIEIVFISFIALPPIMIKAVD
jgi:hypothetical protein